MTRKQFSAPHRKPAEGKSFPAKYRGECAQGDRIKVGDEVRFNEADALEHVDCHPEITAAFGPVCRTVGCLYENMQHKGACDL